MNKYTFIFEIGWRDPETGRLKPHEYRKKTQMSINDARAYARRLDRKSTRLNSSHRSLSRMPSSA